MEWYVQTLSVGVWGGGGRRLPVVAGGEHPALQKIDEVRNHCGVKLSPRIVRKLLDRYFDRESLAVRAIRGHGVKGIGYRENARFDEQLVGGDMMRVAVAVIA